MLTQHITSFLMYPKNYYLPLFFLLYLPISLSAQEIDSLPVKGLCIAAPTPNNIDRFTTFISEELVPNAINTLVLRINYNYAYESHPELRGENPLTKDQIKQLVRTCQKHDIQLIPLVNLLGHQSWRSTLGKLLSVYPEFDETPHIELPEEYQWPNEDGLYCKSYCPLHPGVHAVVFDIVDEICEVFETKAFHAGMDEVFYLANEKCPRCAGRDPAELFAGEVTKIRNHLANQGITLWIWGDRLIDGKETGIGMWEGSYNNTHRAIDMIPQDVVICDWHYERADKTAVYFAMKGFHVMTCPWRNPEVAAQQVEDMFQYRASATPAMKKRYRGILQTIWSDLESFLNEYENSREDAEANSDIISEGSQAATHPEGLSQSACFKTVIRKVKEYE